MNFIIDCTYVYEGELAIIEANAKIDLTTGIVNNFVFYDDIEAGNCLSESVEFIFEQNNYYLSLEYKGKNLCVKDMNDIALFQSIQNMLQLQNELPMHGSNIKKSKI